MPTAPPLFPKAEALNHANSKGLEVSNAVDAISSTIISQSGSFKPRE
jgi:hypothetical protein